MYFTQLCREKKDAHDNCRAIKSVRLALSVYPIMRSLPVKLYRESVLRLVQIWGGKIAAYILLELKLLEFKLQLSHFVFTTNIKDYRYPYLNAPKRIEKSWILSVDIEDVINKFIVSYLMSIKRSNWRAILNNSTYTADRLEENRLSLNELT